MKGCWDPEFEPSVEEIVDYPVISLWRFSQFAFSSELAFRAGGFPYSVEHMAGEGQRATGSSRAPQYTRVRSMRSLSTCSSSNLWRLLFMRDSGCSLLVVHYVQSPNSQKRIRPRDEVIMTKPMMKPMMKLG